MTKKNILVVEDNHQLGESLFDMLELANFNPHIALTGRDGIKHALEHHPDLIILDIRLPDISGYDVYHRIREDSWGKDAKVLILTASESIEIN
jgi:two-component system copper resistance phosphate regulon response regulator CusR